jgi:hypothetical protein
MSVAASSPSTFVTPSLPPLEVKASFSLLVSLVSLARVLAFSLSFLSTILAIAQTPEAAAGEEPPA